jgi:hypothetical protein
MTEKQVRLFFQLDTDPYSIQASGVFLKTFKFFVKQLLGIQPPY